MKKHSILLIDDEETILISLQYALVKNGYQVDIANNPDDALAKVKEFDYSVVVTDLRMKGQTGLEVLNQIRKIRPNTFLLIMTGYATLESAIEAIRVGVADFMLKPCKEGEIAKRISLCLEQIEKKWAVEKHTAELEKINQKLQEELALKDKIENELRESQQSLLQHNQSLQQLSILDALTGVFNRRYFDETLDKEVKRSAREKQELCLLMMDIDYFKNFNDTYGHQAGDDCLKRVSHALDNNLHRPADFIARYGGEEFAVVLPGTGSQGGIQVAEALRSAVSGLSIPHKSSQTINHVTVSIGLAYGIPHSIHSEKNLIACADRALYKAKEQGRNRVELESFS